MSGTRAQAPDDVAAELRQDAEGVAAGLAAAARFDRSRLLTSAERVAAAHDVAVEQAPAPSTVLLEADSVMGVFAVAEVVVTTAVGGRADR